MLLASASGVGLFFTPGVLAGEPSENIEDFTELDLDALLAAPVVRAASHREQSLYEAASSVTVLTHQEIEASSATCLAELLRRVPGMHVMQTGANTFNIGLRGINGMSNNRVLVLINGRQIADGLQGYVPWGALPVHPGDVERIEIIRGPGSTLYGRDALNGVVNIVTKSPLIHTGMETFASWNINHLGEQTSGSAEDWMTNGGGGYLAQNWANPDRTLGFRLSFSLNQVPEWQMVRTGSFHGPFHYSLMASLDYRPDNDLHLFFTASHAYAELMFLAPSPTVPYTTRYSKQAFTLQFEKKRFITDALTLKVEADGRRLLDEYKISGILVGSGFSVQESGRWEPYTLHAMALLDLSLFGGADILTVGAEMNYLHIEKFSTRPWQFFAAAIFSNETRFFSGSLLLFLDARMEFSLSEEEDFGQVTHHRLNPRAALVWMISEQHSLRLSGASSYRLPTPYELFADIKLSFDDSSVPPVRYLIGNPRLEPEVLYSLEAGYRGLWREELRVDAVLFAQRLEGLVDNIRENFTPAYMENSDVVRHLGLELGLRYTPSPAFSAYLNYTFTYGRSSDERRRDWPAHIYSLGAEVRLPHRIRMNLDAYLVFDFRPTVSRLMNIETGYPYFSWMDIQTADQAFINLRFGRFFADNRLEVFISVKNLLGFFRESDGLRMYPIAEAQPIGGTLMAGVIVRGL